MTFIYHTAYGRWDRLLNLWPIVFASCVFGQSDEFSEHLGIATGRSKAQCSKFIQLVVVVVEWRLVVVLNRVCQFIGSFSSLLKNSIVFERFERKNPTARRRKSICRRKLVPRIKLASSPGQKPFFSRLLAQAQRNCEQASPSVVSPSSLWLGSVSSTSHVLNAGQQVAESINLWLGHLPNLQCSGHHLGLVIIPHLKDEERQRDGVPRVADTF